MDIEDIQNIKVKRTKEDIRKYNRLYYAYVRKDDRYYQHYVKEYHSNNKGFYQYKYNLRTMESMIKKHELKIFQQQAKIIQHRAKKIQQRVKISIYLMII